MHHVARPSWRILRTAPAMLALLWSFAAPAGTQTAVAPDARGTVLVNGARGNIDGGLVIDPASNALLNGQSASSCAFIGPYNPEFDPVTEAYMREFTPRGSISRDVMSVSEYAPMGDVSNPPIPSALRGARPRGRGFHGLSPFSSGCSMADLRFAAGRAHVARNDKTLGQAFEALKGDRDAEFALGTFFYEGGVVNRDVKTARGWFDAAAKQGQPDAMYNLGAMLSRGEGGPQDLALAYVWLSLAGTAGQENAAAALRDIGPKLTAQDRARADKVLKPGPKS